MSKGNLILSIYSRPECHLCEEMFEALKPWQKRYGFVINIVDIDSDIELTKRFAARIPVLLSSDVEICQYYLDEAALKQFFQNSSLVE